MTLLGFKTIRRCVDYVDISHNQMECRALHRFYLSNTNGAAHRDQSVFTNDTCLIGGILFTPPAVTAGIGAQGGPQRRFVFTSVDMPKDPLTAVNVVSLRDCVQIENFTVELEKYV